MRKNSTKFIVLLFVSYFLAFWHLNAQNSDEEIMKKLPKIASGNALSNAGREFWWSVPPAYDQVSGNGNFIKVFIISSVATDVTIEIPGKGRQDHLRTFPNEVVGIDYLPGIATPFTYNYTSEKWKQADIYPGNGIHVIANDPITVYCMVRYQYTSDGWLCLPVSGLGKDYVVAAYYDYDWPGGRLPAVCTVTAVYDSTNINVQMEGTLSSLVQSSFDGNRYGPGQFIPVPTMQTGDVFAFMATGETGGNDITGTRISANKPISVVAGVYCAWIPLGNTACDYIGEQLLPTETWGQCIHVPQVSSRLKPGVIRIFNSVTKTTVFRDGTQVAYLPDATGLEGKAWLEARVVPIDSKLHPATYTADKPFNIVYYNPGQTEDGIPSDPFEMTTVPVEQYVNELSFCTPRNPSNPGDLGFAKNFIQIIYELDSNKLTPSDLEWGTVSSGGNVTWHSFEANFGGTGYVFTTSYKGKWYASKNISIGDGVYKVRCPSAKFTAYSYGFGSYDSYGYPSGVGLKNKFIQDSLPPEPEYTIEPCSGNVLGAKVTDRPDDKDLRSNLALFITDSINNYNFKYASIQSGEEITVPWSLTVLDPSKDSYAKLTFIDKAGNDTTIEIKTTGINMIMTQDGFFGDFVNGNLKGCKTFKIYNNSSDTVTISQLKLQKGSEFFKIVEPLPFDINKPIKSGDSVQFQVCFDPNNTQNGKTNFADSIGFYACQFKNYVKISAEVNSPKIIVTDWTINNVSIRDSIQQSKILSLRNISTYPVIINSVSNFSTYSPFSSPQLVAWKALLPQIIQPSGEVLFKVLFNPAIVGNFSENLIFSSNAGNTSDSIMHLEGTSITTYDISGTIFLNGAGYDGVVVTLGTKTDLSKNGGQYIFRNLAPDYYNIIPILNDNKFVPSHWNIDLTKNTSNLNFKIILTSINDEKQPINNDLIVIPNPISGNKLTLKINKELLGKAKLKIINNLSQELISSEILIESGMNEFNVDIEKLNSGTYFINLDINNEILKCKFEVVK